MNSRRRSLCLWTSILRYRAVFIISSLLVVTSPRDSLHAQVAASNEAPCTVESSSPPNLERTTNLVRAELFASAECSARRLVENQPESADAHYLLGYILNRRDRADDSLKEYTAGAKYRRPSSNDLAIVALDYAILKSFSDAAKWMREALRGDPNNAAYWYYLGRILYSQNAFGQAQNAYQTSLALHPDEVRVLYNLGLTYEGLNQVDKAAELYQQAIAVQQQISLQDAQPYYDLGSLLARQNHEDQALPLLEKAAQIEPRNPAILERLARTEERVGQLDRSLANLKAAVSLKPDVSSLHFELGHIYKKLNMTEEAKRQFDLCSKMTGTHSSVGSDSLDFARP